MSNKNQYIRDEIQDINAEINDIREFLEFGASDSWHYKLARIDLELLREKREKYKELLD